MSDAYDEAVEYFYHNSDEVYDAWDMPSSHKYGYLFSFLSKGRSKFVYKDDYDQVKTCGCPIMVHGEKYKAEKTSLTKFCRASRILPEDVFEDDDFTLQILQELARIQRLADTILERKPINARLWMQQHNLGEIISAN